MTVIIYPVNPVTERGFDPEFTPEVGAVRWDAHLASVDHDALVDDVAVFRNLPDTASEILYRGWMVTVEEFALIHDTLASRGISMLTTPGMYAAAHKIDGWVDAFDGLTFDTVLLPVDFTAQHVTDAVAQLGGSSFFVKDYVKSLREKGFGGAVPVEALEQRLHDFRSEMGEYLVGGFAVRRFVELPADRAEVRGWWRDGQWRVFTPHPDYKGRSIQDVPQELLDEVTARLQRLGVRFVTVDFTPTVAEGWKVIEVGDGQVSGFPDDLDDDTIKLILL